MNIEVGTTATPGGADCPALLDVEELLATRLLVQGNSGSGKSHLLRRLIEQSASLVQQVVIDPEGDFVSLTDRFDHLVLDAERSLKELDEIARRVRQHRVSAVLNLEGLDAEMQMRAAGTFLNALFDADREHWYPMLVVVDEAQLFAPAVSGDVAEDVRRLSLGAMTNLMCRGRKRGLAGIIATQRLAKLAKNVAAEASNFLMGRTFLDIDMVRAADLLGLERRQAESFRELQRGHFVALGPALSRRPLSIRVGGVATQPRAGTPRLTPLPDASPEHRRDLILASLPAETSRPAVERRLVPPPPPSANEILERYVRDRPAAAEEPAGLPPHEREAAFRTIAHAIMLEPEATFRADAVLYQDFQVRCRIQRVGGTPLPLSAFKVLINVARAGIELDAVDADAWGQAIAIAQAIPEDLQAIYLMVAGAALTGVPCPSDAEMARRGGTYSAGRSRSRLRHLERSGHIVTRTDIRGNRVAALPDLGWETLPGDPKAPASLPPASSLPPIKGLIAAE